MKVIEVIKSACDFIGLEDIKTAIEEEIITDQDQKVIDKLLKCFNLVQEEIATEFLPLSFKESITATERINFISLQKNILKVLSVKKGKENLSFKVYPDHVCFKGNATEITYNYLPEEVEINDDILYLVPIRIYSYGIAREYFLFEGLADKAILFENRFRKSIETLIKKDDNIVMPVRKWF